MGYAKVVSSYFDPPTMCVILVLQSKHFDNAECDIPFMTIEFDNSDRACSEFLPGMDFCACSRCISAVDNNACRICGRSRSDHACNRQDHVDETNSS